MRPILKANCGTCHSAKGVGYEASGFSVASYAALMKGTKFGPVIVPGHSKRSNLLWLLEHGAHSGINLPKICERMGVPADKCTAATSFARELPKSNVRVIAQWIDRGDPRQLSGRRRRRI